jgi:hypothetical protein
MSSLPGLIMDKIKHLSGEKSASKPVLRESTRKRVGQGQMGEAADPSKKKDKIGKTGLDGATAGGGVIPTQPSWTCNVCESKFANCNDEVMECEKCCKHFC